MPRNNSTDVNDNNLIQHDHNHDGIDRRGFLKCMAWAGAGTLCVVEGGVLQSFALGHHSKSAAKGQLSFVQISDSHMPGAGCGKRALVYAPTPSSVATRPIASEESLNYG